MSKVQDYPSRLGDNSSRKFETFSYLPAMNDKQIRQQVQYIVDQGYNPGVEHTEVENAMENYWYMWKLPYIQQELYQHLSHQIKEVSTTFFHWQEFLH